MIVNNGENQITLPDLVKVGDSISARWANSLRDCVQKLRDRKPTAISQTRTTKSTHPFKIVATTEESELRIYVCFGVVTYMIWNTAEEPIYKDGQVYFAQSPGLTYLKNDPFYTTPVGYFVGAVSTSYGVWLKVARNAAGSLNSPAGSAEPYTTVDYSSFITGSEILVTSSFTDPTATPTYDSDFAHIYLGKVTYDSAGAPTVIQFRRSDVITSLASWPTNFTIVSADAGNQISTGTDGGAYGVIVSTDASNDITAGTDGGSYYNDPDY
jgi:hypothetical protein